jgi:hypothetical protein
MNTDQTSVTNQTQPQPEAPLKSPDRPPKLQLKRTRVQSLNDSLLTSQGHSLWTCDSTGGR